LEGKESKTEPYAKPTAHENNGNGKPLFMKINRGFDPDPLRPRTHRVVYEVEPGKFEILGNTAEPLEMLSLMVEMNHASDLAMRKRNCLIVGEEQQIEARFESYVPQSQVDGEPINDFNLRLRSRWIAAMIKWLLPVGILDFPDTPDNAKSVQEALKEKKVEISISPTGKEVIIWRDSLPLADWSC
jgi:hypothetical protein